LLVMSDSNYYKVGGSLDYQNPSYVVRQADSHLYEGLKAGDFYYVLNSRQMGKSSLRVRTMKKLQAEGISCASIDITNIGSHSLTPENWYGGIAFELLSSFNLLGKINFNSWWGERSLLPPVQRLNQLFKDVLLVEFSQNIVIFIDEIDSSIEIDFKDDFFAFIRACYNQRVDNPRYNRLTFCLLGVATPSDLIADKKRTPFNIGRAIELTGFKLEEAKLSLTQGLAQKVDNPEKVLKGVLDWTGGQPFLTQKLCKLVTERAKSRKPNIKQLVQKYVIDNWESQDEPEHLRTIRDRILRNEQRTSRLLGLYQQILQQGEIAADDSSEQMELRLSGLVVKQNGKLRVYNRIYEAVFNQSWVNQQLANLRPYSEAIAAWLESKRQDESRLLRGQALQEALKWKVGKSLSVEDNDFLDVSQQFTMREMRRELEAERQAKQILEKANQQAEQLIKEAHEGTKIERAGFRALQVFEAGGREIEALLLAMQAGQALQKLVQDGRLLKDYPATSPLLALQVILHHIRERNQFSEHQNLVWSVSFSPNGEYIATASLDRTAKLWDLSGKQLAEFIGHQDGVYSVYSVSFSTNGEYIATASSDNTARLWDLSGNQIAEFIGHQGTVMSVSFNPNGEYIATASHDGTAKLWDLSGNQLVEFQGHQNGVMSVSFSPNGDYIATASLDSTARLWDLSGNQIAEFIGHQHGVNSVNFSPNGEYVATASSDDTARLWDLSGNQIVEFIGHQDGVNSVNFSPNGEYIATASSDCTARLWDLSGNQIAEFKGHQGWVISVSFSPNGEYIVTASSDSTARLWDISRKHLAEFIVHQDWFQEWGVSITFSPDGEYLATFSGYEDIIRLWDLSGNQIAEFIGHQNSVLSVSFSPNGEYIATASYDHTAKLWDLSGKQLAEFIGHQRGISCVSFSPNGQYIATASFDSTIRLWDFSGNQIAEFQEDQSEVNSVIFSPSGKYIATTSNKRTARLWDLHGNQIAEFSGHQYRVMSVSFSPNGECIATANCEGSVGLWDLSGNQIVEFIVSQDTAAKPYISFFPENIVLSVSFSPNGEYLATASNDGIVRLWDLSGKQIAEVKAHQGMVTSGGYSGFGIKTSVTFSPNGKYLATTSDEGIARLWDLSGNQLAEFQGYQHFVDNVTFSPSGEYIATASHHGTVRLWRVEGLDELLARGCDWLKYYLASDPEAREKLKACTTL
jgi:WD40 repeat protein/vacuolar-type H+-ATPase subunit H